jgi:hypothetical protein
MSIINNDVTIDDSTYNTIAENVLHIIKKIFGIEYSQIPEDKRQEIVSQILDICTDFINEFTQEYKKSHIDATEEEISEQTSIHLNDLINNLHLKTN